MDGYDYLNDYIGLWGYYDIDLWLRVHEDSTFEFVNSEDEAIYTGTADADEYGMDLYFDDDTPQMRLDLSVSGDLLEVAWVIKGLMWRDHRRGLSNGERKMLHSAKQILISEVVLVEGTDDYPAVEQRINEAMMLGA